MSDVSAERVALVTGGSGGIGRAIAKRLAEDGFHLVVHYNGNAQRAAETVAEIEAAGGRAVAVQGDIAKVEDVTRLFAAATEAFGRVDVVVNSAGIMKLSRIEDADVELFDSIVSANLRGAFVVMGEAARTLGHGGRIIMLTSSVIGMSFPGYGAYIASKAGVEGLVRVMANELRGRGISVNAVAPGPIPTELFLAGKSEEQIAKIKNMATLETRFGTAEEIAAAVSFLAGPDGTWVNAQILRVNGGFV